MDVEGEDEGELVWDPDWDEARKAEAWAKQDRPSAAAAGEGDLTAASALQTKGEEAEDAG